MNAYTMGGWLAMRKLRTSVYCVWTYVCMCDYYNVPVGCIAEYLHALCAVYAAITVLDKDDQGRRRHNV